MAEERDQVVLPTGSPLAPDLPGATPLGGSVLDDVDVPRTVSTAGLGPGGSADRLDVGVAPGAAATSGTGAAAGSDDADRIREQIERTREDMSQTINELQERLSPQHLAQQARESVREATVGRVQQMFGSASDTASQVARRAQEAAGPVVEQVREHPLPLALAGAGAGLMWFLMRRSSSRQTWSSNDMYEWDDDATGTREYASPDLRNDDGSDHGGWLQMLRDNPIPASIAAASVGYMLWNRRSTDAYDFDRSPAYAGYDDDPYATSTTERVGAAARDMGRQASEKASALGSQVSDTASALGHQVSEKASALGHQVSEKASALGHQVSDQVSGTVRAARVRAREVTRDTSTQFDRWMQDNPLAIGVAALAAGAVVGLTVPVTSAENRAMGASRDALLERASDSAAQIKEQVRDKVQEVRTKVEEVAGDLATSAANATKAPDGPAGV